MKRKGMIQRTLAAVLGMAVVFSMSGMTVLAHGQRDSAQGCVHHTEHNADCGYAAEIGSCSHTHDTECYRQVLRCSHIHTESCHRVDDGFAGCVHVHDEACYGQEIDCGHAHNEACAYMETAPQQPCEYVCSVCSGTALSRQSRDRRGHRGNGRHCF